MNEPTREGAGPQPSPGAPGPASGLLPRTRLQAPSMPSSPVSRPRLLEMLESGANLPVTVVTGLPGAGKTTLVAQWAQTSDSALAWVTCDRADTDPEVLWVAVTTALANSGIQPAEVSAETQGSGSMPDPAAIINQIESAGRPLTLVIDDAHLPGEALAVLQPLIDWLPAHGRLIVISRRQPALPLAELQVRGRLLEVRDADLRLTCFETAQFLEHLGVDERPHVIDEIHRQSEGWLASVALTAQALSTDGNDTATIDAIVANVPPALAAFLRDELVESSTPRLRDFLLDVCVLEELTQDACAATIGPENVGCLLAELEHSGLPVEYLPATGAYRLHGQFRTVLHELAVSRDPERLVRQHAKAAAGFEALDDHPRAIQHYTRAGEHEAAVSLVATSVLRGNYAQAITAVAAWLEEADLDLVRSDPSGQAQVLAATGSMLEGQWVSARRWLDRADALLPNLDDRVQSQAAICWSALYLIEGDLESVERQFQAAERHRNGWPPVWTVLHFLLVSRARLWSDQIESAKEALAAVDHDPKLDQLTEVAVLAMRAEIAVATGEVAQAVKVADEAVATIGYADDAAHTTLQDAYRARGLASYEQGHLDTAETDLTAALKAADPARPAMASVALTGLAKVLAARGHIDDALDTLVQARRLLPTQSALQAAITTTEARIDLRIGDLDRARRVIQNMHRNGLRLGLEAQLAIADGDAEAAAAKLDQLPIGETPRGRLDRALLTARIELLRDQRRAARRALSEALAIAESHHLVRPFFEDGAQLWPLLTSELGRRPRSTLAWALQRENDRLAEVEAQAPDHDPNVAARLGTLTGREREILNLLASDRSVRQLADDLHISMNTIRTHIKSIYRKLGVTTRAEAARALI